MTLHKEEILSVDEETGGYEEFVVMDFISSTEDSEAYICISGRGEAIYMYVVRQLLLALNDMWDTNGGTGVVYGFATTGQDWQMVTYDGKFRLTE